MGKMVNRQLVGINLPNEMALWLRQKSEESGTPVSRLVEKMLIPYHEKDKQQELPPTQNQE